MRIRGFASAAAVAAVLGSMIAGFGPARASHPSALAFAPSVKPPCENITGFNCGNQTEPAIAVDGDGNLYLSSILGVPGGVNLWKRPAGDTHLQYLGLPDADAILTPATGLAPGGGDVDLAIATAKNAGGFYNLYVASLSLASVTFLRSEDGGQTWAKRDLISTAPIFDVDRQWIIADGASNVYLVFRDGEPRMWWIRASADGGDTWSVPFPLITPENIATAANPLGLASRAGNLAMNRTTKDVYMPFTNAADPIESIVAAQDPSGSDPTNTVPSQNLTRHVVSMARWNAFTQTTTNAVVHSGPPDVRVDAIFPTAAVDAAGNVYAGWSTTQGVFAAVSGDNGATWSAPVQVSEAPASTTIQPWLAAGDAGRVALAFLATSSPSLADPDADWHAYMSISTNAACQLSTSCGVSGLPDFDQIQVSDHVMHHGTVCLLGLRCDINGLAGLEPSNRALAEVTAINIDADGMAVVSWPDDGDGGATFPYIAKQIGGPALIGDPAPAALLAIEALPGPGTFVPGPPAEYLFHNDTDSPQATPDGYDLDGPFIVGTLSTAPPDNPHVGVVGYATTETPGVSRPAVFETAPLGDALGIGGSPLIKLFLEGEAGANFTGVIEYRLVEVPATGPPRTLGSRSIAGNATDDCCRYRPGVVAPRLILIAFPGIDPALVAAGSKIRLEMRFTAAVQSATRFFYDSPVFPASLTLTTGTFTP